MTSLSANFTQGQATFAFRDVIDHCNSRCALGYKNDSLRGLVIETHKWQRERETYEDRIHQLEVELSSALEAHTHLGEQKQENLLLKEMIDRMDEVRNAASSNTMSKSLDAELAGKMNWDMDGDGEGDSGEIMSPQTTVVGEDETEEEEDEDVIQTIITKRKRYQVERPSCNSTRNAFEELKEYSDGSTQYDPTLFAVNHGMQTKPERKPLKASFSVQTKALPVPPPHITVEMDIQTVPTEEQEPEQEHFESMVSSSFTIVPPTPEPSTSKELPSDAPPAYDQVTGPCG